VSQTPLLIITGLALLAAVAALVAALVALAVALAKARRTRARRPSAPPSTRVPTDPFRESDDDALRGDPRTLIPGDLVEIRNHTYAIRGSLAFAEGAWGWAEHLLDDAHDDKVWISVEEDPDLEVALWRAVPSATLTPGAATIDFDGRRYHSDESGQARFTCEGTTGLDPTGIMRYHDYTAPGGALLSFERYGDAERWEMARGERLHRHELRIFRQAPAA
jgi:Domain of unknown function (DUF4178)